MPLRVLLGQVIRKSEHSCDSRYQPKEWETTPESHSTQGARRKALSLVPKWGSWRCSCTGWAERRSRAASAAAFSVDAAGRRRGGGLQAGARKVEKAGRSYGKQNYINYFAIFKYFLQAYIWIKCSYQTSIIIQWEVKIMKFLRASVQDDGNSKQTTEYFAIFLYNVSVKRRNSQ